MLKSGQIGNADVGGHYGAPEGVARLRIPSKLVSCPWSMTVSILEDTAVEDYSHALQAKVAGLSRTAQSHEALPVGRASYHGTLGSSL